ncbi:MAG: BatA and WFA domain-containing protein [Bacteroidota bacterium]|nr:BatA and WFA domain-containing protein [Bacteroidota bacterium]
MGFLTPLFLAAAGAAVIPVMLHLVRRMRAREVPFSSLMFLTATPIQKIRRRRLQDVLLMLLRAAVLVLLAAVFARPYLLQEDIPTVFERQQESVVILVDVSLSMQHEGRFAQALELAQTRLTQGNEWALVAFSRGAEQLTALGRDRDLHRDVLSRLESSFASTDYFPALSLAADILQDARYASRTIVLVSDFQQTGFSAAMDNLVLPEGIAFEPIAVGSGTLDNRYFTDFAATMHRRGELVAIHLDARIHPEGEVTLTLQGNDEAVQYGSAVSFRPVTDRTGPVLGQLFVRDAETQADDYHYFTYDVRPRPEVVIVDSTVPQRTAFFLRSAFELGEASQYQVVVRRAPAQLSGADMVIVADAAALSASDIRTLAGFARRGGSVVLACSSSELPGPSALLGTGLADALISNYDLQSAAAIIADVDDQHPALSLFAGGPILRPRIRQYVRVAADSLAQTIATYDTGDPFLIERALGRGRVLLFTSSLSTEWTDLPLTEVFVPLLYRIAGYATGISAAPPAYTVGDAVSITGAPDGVWEVSDPEGAIYTVEADSAGLGFFRQADLPGHYRIRQGRTGFSIAVNVDPGEADLTARDTEEAYAAVTYQRTASGETERLPVDQEQQQNLWRVLLIAVLGLFVLESVLSSRR